MAAICGAEAQYTVNKAEKDKVKLPWTPYAEHGVTSVRNVSYQHPMARALGGFPDADAASCTGADRYGLDLKVTTRRGIAYTRVGFADPITGIDELRSATVELVRRARAS